MGRIRWYKRDPNAALAGFAVLTLEERGAYETVLDLIYAHDGDLNDDEHFLAGWMRSDVRVWRRLRKRLVDLGKIYIHAGKIRNERADREIDDALHRVASAATAGKESWRKREGRSKVIKDLGLAIVQRPFELSTSTKIDITTTESFAAREEEANRKSKEAIEAMRLRLARARR